MTSRVLPLDGVCVLDMTQLWAGPMTTRMLASFGATVIKVESPQRPDSLRTLGSDLAQRFPDGEPEPDPENRNAWFNTQNHDKLGVVIDVKQPRGLRLIESLAKHCQILVSNARAGVMDRLGLGYDRYVELRGEDAIVVEMSAFGAGGSRGRLAGFGAQFEAATGAPRLIGARESPVLTGFAFGDPVGGLVSATAVATAYYQARRTGRGAYLETSLVEAYMSMIGDVFLDASAATESTGWGGNRHPAAAPHGIYPLADQRAYIAIGVGTDQQWQNLVRCTGIASFASPELVDTAARLRAREQLDSALSEWTSKHTEVSALVGELQQAGVPAAPVADSGMVARDEFLCSSGFYTALEHPSTGRHPYPGLPYVLDGSHMPLRNPAPRWGEHTDQVLREFAGIDEEELTSLATDGVIVRGPGARIEAATGW
ncbi:benzylsuccinate CoA-transferase BbsF subunit [Tamaricihabitans halophyticus]|uniref:Benzylsuccinate CoA-transferase BbsF subunit n=1 Tax=Tamaricihabitans halophyticus TaxID=1262583 RepID=A0A4R2QLB9_9PSEU|nr:CoA transferase [Tamaricihabitans halophyticus]TCP47831.1 benzylsuccinate CoA-transferase BbsF subunit [Tamaricihabitans halophyticus]